MNFGDITDDVNDIIQLGLALVELADGAVLKELINNVNPLSTEISIVKESFHSQCYLNDEENIKIENGNNKRKKLFSPESTNRLTTNLNAKIENLPHTSLHNLSTVFLKRYSFDNDKQWPSLQVQEKNSQSSSSNNQVVCKIASNKSVPNAVKRISNSSKPGLKSLQLHQKTNVYAEWCSRNKRLIYNTTGNKKVQNSAKRIRNCSSNKTGPNFQVLKKNARTPNKRLVCNKNISNAIKGISNCSSNKTQRPKAPKPLIFRINKCLTLQDNVKKKIECIPPALEIIQEQVRRAIKEKKTFTICGYFKSIREALVSRGWVEKMRILYCDKSHIQELLTRSIPELLRGLHDPEKGHLFKRMITTKLLGSHQVDFYWDQTSDCFRMCSDNYKYTLMNCFKRRSHSSKQGLCEAMKYAHWYQKPGFSMLRQPRTYRTSNNEELKDFIKDFNQTAVISLLKWVVRSGKHGQTFRVVSKEGKVSLRAYYFAIKEVIKLLRQLNHQDIDCAIKEPEDCEWNFFLKDFYKIVHCGDHFKSSDIENVSEMRKTSMTLLKKLNEYFPTFRMDGMTNMWIMKPIYGAKGQGIRLCKTLDYVFKIIKTNTMRRYIIQKYIERPLLIYRTKFDVRQWFLISCAFPLTMWIYNECYIRFSSQLYSLQRLHESIHLTNNAIQNRYKNCSRNRNLPECNMWDSTQFQEYLASIERPTVYTEIIYPGMKEGIIAAMLINQEKIDTRKNCFELYGCDFMLSEDFKPWLIEINSNPALFGSTTVTARLCPRVLEDLVKVVIDRRKDPNASTGGFELLYKQNIERYPIIDENELFLMGKELPPDYFCQDESNLSDDPTL